VVTEELKVQFYLINNYLKWPLQLPDCCLLFQAKWAQPTNKAVPIRQD